MTSLIISSSAVLVSIIAGLIAYKKLEPAWLRLFVFYLLLTFFAQIGGYLYSWWFQKSNHFIFNFLMLIGFGFYFYAFWVSIRLPKLKWFMAITGIVFTTAALANLFFGESVTRFNIHTYSVGSILILVCCLVYFIELFMADHVVNFFRIPMFWISTGLFFFFTGNFIYLSIMGYIQKNHLDPDGSIYVGFNVVLSVTMYLLCAIGFLCNYQWKKANS